MFINKKKLHSLGRNQLGKWAMFSPLSNRKLVKHFIMLKRGGWEKKRKRRNFWSLETLLETVSVQANNVTFSPAEGLF